VLLFFYHCFFNNCAKYIMDINLIKFNEDIKENKKSILNSFKSIRKQKTNRIDTLFKQMHVDVFSETDCLTCANCCKTTSPVFKSKDIENIAKYLKLKPTQLVEKYLFMDDEGDYVVKKSPCAFLNEDNSCNIYDVRPIACQGYPHTDRRKVHSILSITESNAMVCPAVNEMVKRIDLILNPIANTLERKAINRKAR